MDNVRRKHLSFRKARIKMLVSDQVAETCDACDRTEGPPFFYIRRFL